MPPGRISTAEPERGASGVDAEVVVVGAGPVGCWLAAELCAAGVDVLVLEARESRVAWSRGFVIHPRTLEILDSRGVARQLVDAGRRLPSWHFAMGSRRLDFAVLPTAFPYVLIQPQARTEELLEAHLNAHGGSVLRGRRAVGLTQYPDRVAVQVRDESGERTSTARYVVGCDGARSSVRQAAGIGFSGNPDTLTGPSALVELADPPPPDQYMQTREQGQFFAIPLPDGRFVVSTIDHTVMHEVDTPWTAEMVRASLIRITGTDYGMGEPERVSTLGNSAKQAHRYRDGRVLLAGDAAHVHFPMGGQGMNLGIQDAHNLAWRLAAAVRTERAGAPVPDTLLDGYEAERRPVGERVLEDVRAQMALVAAKGADGVALRARFDALLHEHPEVNRQYALRLSGLDVRYPAVEAAETADSAAGAGSEKTEKADGDPRVGARVPDLVLETADGEARLYDLLRGAGAGRFARLRLGEGSGTGSADGVDGADPGRPVVDIAALSVRGPEWALRAGWALAEAVLIRPDGHVAGISAPTSAFG